MSDRIEKKGVAIIGAGIIGACTAFWLQKQGYHVILVDPEAPGSGASFGNACSMATYACVPVGTPSVFQQIPKLILDPDSPLSLKWQYLPHMVPWFLRFLEASRPHRVEAIAGHLASLINEMQNAYDPIIAATQTADMFQQKGVLYLHRTEEGFQRAQADMDLRRRHGIELSALSQGEILELEPNLAPNFAKGVIFPTGSHLSHPQKFVASIVETVIKAGGTWIAAPATDIRRTEQGLTVHTEKEVIKTDKIVIAAGAWSKNLVKSLQDSVPLDTERGYHALFAGSGELVSRPVGLADLGFYMTPMEEGLRVAGTVEFAGLKRPANMHRVTLLEKGARILLPNLPERDSHWMGFRPSMPDSLPVISRANTDRDVFYAFGHGHIGLTLGGITGKLISELVSDQTPSLDLRAFSASRFQ